MSARKKRARYLLIFTVIDLLHRNEHVTSGWIFKKKYTGESSCQSDLQNLLNYCMLFLKDTV